MIHDSELTTRKTPRTNIYKDINDVAAKEAKRLDISAETQVRSKIIRYENRQADSFLIGWYEITLSPKQFINQYLK